MLLLLSLHDQLMWKPSSMLASISVIIIGKHTKFKKLILAADRQET
jgi:hypothetical protein